MGSTTPARCGDSETHPGHTFNEDRLDGVLVSWDECPGVRSLVTRIRLTHPDSGNTLLVDVLETVGEAPRRKFQLLPDGLLEAVVVHEGPWTVLEGPTQTTRR